MGLLSISKFDMGAYSREAYSRVGDLLKNYTSDTGPYLKGFIIFHDTIFLKDEIYK